MGRGEKRGGGAERRGGVRKGGRVKRDGGKYCTFRVLPIRRLEPTSSATSALEFLHMSLEKRETKGSSLPIVKGYHISLLNQLSCE